MFCWTPPHFWALAIRYADDYRAADVPMLPAVVPLVDAARQMIAYTAAMVVATLVLVPVADLGWIYAVAAVVLGAGFLGGDRRPRSQPDAGGEHARVHLQHHVRHVAVRRARLFDVLRRVTCEPNVRRPGDFRSPRCGR